MNPVAATFKPRSLGAPRQRLTINISADSEDSISKDTTKVTTPQTSRQWSDEVAVQDEEEAVSEQRVKAQDEQSRREEGGAGSKSQKTDRQKAFTEAIDRALKSGLASQDNDTKSSDGTGRLFSPLP